MGSACLGLESQLLLFSHKLTAIGSADCFADFTVPLITLEIGTFFLEKVENWCELAL
jgi:hypothetical protein